SGEDIEPIMDVVDKTGLVLRCRYCTRTLDVNELKYY
ncbi:MAG TPA: aspartate carbamoyltransferase regulatory subunit, partial [Nitrosopumilaceae archaeon]|nr:aspartate carbamoyltransferase regulatory subunit [Nitrosopumilaceae archaeon]